MRRSGLALVTLMCISFLLVPFNSLHAHVSVDHNHILLHGGHSHDAATGTSPHDIAAEDHLVQVHFAVADGGAKLKWTHWLPLLASLGFLLHFLPRITSSCRPVGSDDWPVQRRGHWRPPLRGPPPISI